MSDIVTKENIPSATSIPVKAINQLPSPCSTMDLPTTTDDHHNSSSSSSSEEPLTPIPITIENAPPSSSMDLEKQKLLVLEEGVRWCQRCGTIETPRWRFGPAGPLTLCNACHLRWKTQGRPSLGYSSTTFPPPHYSPSCLKRKRTLKTNESGLKRVKKEEEEEDSDPIIKSVHSDTKKAKLSMSPPPKTPEIIPGTCSSCHCTSTPLWRKGPLGPKTLCNACGLKWAKEADRKPSTTSVVKSTASAQTTKKSSIQHSLLHYQKQFIRHGLYADQVRSDKPKPKSRFVFELPIHQGAFLLSKRTDFELPADILQERELGLIKGLKSDRQPSFTRIRSNIFVERKPLTTSADPVVCHCQRPSNESQSGCGEDCINRMLFYECDPRFCPCGEQCSNQRFQRKERKKELQIFQTENRGWGLRTLVDIKKDELVIEYRGEIISHQLCEERMCTIYVNEKNFYFLDYCNGEVIDACYKGTEARFINHSCDPNCHIEKWSLRGESHFGVFASRDIKAHSELFYDYNFSTFNDSVESQQPCYCGTDKCRGTIGRKASSSNNKR
ncbi:hypothetical protein BD560DRAFT_409274 [Blakeslea trispora]|nr:hypothetical protein BD560DRAFT_409274 [Blakeslea trispora]